MSIQTLADWNTRLGYCGCCAMPECPAPSFVTQIKQGEKAEAFYYPFTEPTGEPDDLVPRLYLTQTYPEGRNKTTYNGIRQRLWRNGSVGVGGSSESFEEMLYEDLYLDTDSSSAAFTFNQYDPANTPACASTTDVFGPEGASIFGLGTFTPVACSTAPVCTETSASGSFLCEERNEGASELVPQGCPGPFAHLEEQRYTRVRKEKRVKAELSDELTPTGLTADATAEMVAADWMAEAMSDSPEASVYSLTWPKIGDQDWPACEDKFEANGDILSSPQFSAIAYKKTARNRFRIPETHTGSKFWITYDVAEFPEDGGPSVVSEDNLLEWTGPGIGDPTDPSWLTDQVELDPPEIPGERRMVNIRFTCYSGTRYGSKPQVMGEAFTPPAP